jgi:hypothetical protein
LQLQFETRSIEKFIDRSGDVLGRGAVKSAVPKYLKHLGWYFGMENMDTKI